MKLVEANPVYSKDDELLSMDKEDALMVFETHIRTLEEVIIGKVEQGIPMYRTCIELSSGMRA